MSRLSVWLIDWLVVIILLKKEEEEIIKIQLTVD
jgi:hypothetical protein